MLQRKIVNPSYSYSQGGVVTFACTVQFFAPGGAAPLDSMSAASTRNILGAEWKAEMAAEIAQQADLYEETLLQIIQRARAEFPEAQTPEQIVAQMAGYVEEVCNGVGG